MTSSPMMSGQNSLNLSQLSIISFGGNAGVSTQAAQKPKTVNKFKNALQLIWSALPKKAI